MPQTLTRLLHRLRRMASPAESDSDAALLRRFCGDRDEAAFAALMARHGPMVYGVCRRVLRDDHAADDAFQATFLVLARKAASVGRPESLTGWLYGVAYRVSMKARGMSDVVMSAEVERPDPRPDPLAELSARDLLAVLEQEVQRLPEAFRLPVVLCCLEGLSQEEACRRLGWSAGSLKGRLERGRARLRDRLTRRGLTLTAALAAAEASRGAVSAALLGPAVRAAVVVVAGAWPVAEVSGRVIVLAQGGVQSMAFSNMKTALVLLLGLGLVGSGAGWLAAGAGAERPAEAAQAKPAEKGRSPGTLPSAQEERIAHWKKQLDEDARRAERAEIDQTERLVEARQSLAELEDQLREAEDVVRAAREIGAEEKELRQSAQQLKRELRNSKLSETNLGEDERKLIASIEKRADRYDKLILLEEKERSAKLKRALDHLKELRRGVIQRTEGVRTLERQREAARQEAERRREVTTELIRQLEGMPVPAGGDRRSRVLEQQLDALQATLDGLLQEVKRLRESKRE